MHSTDLELPIPIEILFASLQAREFPFKSSEISVTSREDLCIYACFSLQWLTAPVNSMQTLKFKTKLTNLMCFHYHQSNVLQLLPASD